MKREYIEIRKVSWDAMWHAVFTAANGTESWDRVGLLEAMRIARSLQ